MGEGGQYGPEGWGVLQASREQDRWLDTGQGYTAKGCKTDMRKPCVSAQNTHTASHTVSLTQLSAFLGDQRFVTNLYGRVAKRTKHT